MKSDPNLCVLNQTAIDGYLAQKYLLDNLELSEQDQNIFSGKGVEAEQKICKYYDYLVSCCNPVHSEYWGKSDVHPCRKPFSDAL